MKATIEIKQEIEKNLNNGQTIETVRQFLIKSLDRSGCSELTYKNGGFRLFYTTNDNFQQGIRNGGGAGMYAALKFCGYYKTVKL